MKSQDIKKRYDSSATTYEKRALGDKYQAHKIMTSLVKSKEKLKVLDLGCGTGLSSLKFFKKKYSVTGIDISKEMLKVAKKHPFKKLICQDLEKPLKVKDAEFDLITVLGVMEFIRKPEMFLKRIKKKMKADGRITITFPKKNKYTPESYTKKELSIIFSKVKLKKQKEISFFGYQKPIGNKKIPIKYYGYILTN